MSGNVPRSVRKRKYQRHSVDNMAFYNTASWRKFSKDYKRRHPLCEECYRSHDKLVDADYCDHVEAINDVVARLGVKDWRDVPERYLIGDDVVQSLCRSCDARKRSSESRGEGGVNPEWRSGITTPPQFSLE